MMSEHQVQNISSKQPLTTAAVMARYGIIGAVLLCVAGAFAHTGARLSPIRLTQARVTAIFERTGGRQSGFRRYHAKGVYTTGWWLPAYAMCSLQRVSAPSGSSFSGCPHRSHALRGRHRVDEVLASVPDPTTGKPDPTTMKLFVADHPESVRAIAVIMKSPLSSGFADTTFNSLNAFRRVNAAGKSIPVRWATVPMQPFRSEDAAQTASAFGAPC